MTIIKTASLPPYIVNIVKNKSTETPFSGEYESLDDEGTYLCRQCGIALFRSHTKFHSGCGWPSFDDEIKGNIKSIPDRDGRRTEILCIRCDAHLGHVFLGEGFTDKNRRYCVNSLSLDFVKNLNVDDTKEVILAAGCFWGVQYYLERLEGVLKTEVGYTGGQKDNPRYQEICEGNTGHYEAVRVLYDPTKMNFKSLIKFFFEIHDPTQVDGQGPDIGEQYQSAIFYYENEEKQIAEELRQELNTFGDAVVTKILPAQIFWRAEDYHQHYYQKNKQQPYCHFYRKKFK